MTVEEKSRIKAHLDELCEWVDEQAYSQAESEVLEVREQRDEAFRLLDEMEAKLGTIHEAMKAMEQVWFGLYQSEYVKPELREEYKNMSIAMTCALQLFKSKEAAQQVLEQYSKMM